MLYKCILCKYGIITWITRNKLVLTNEPVEILFTRLSHLIAKTIQSFLSNCHIILQAFLDPYI